MRLAIIIMLWVAFTATDAFPQKSSSTVMNVTVEVVNGSVVKAAHGHVDMYMNTGSEIENRIDISLNNRQQILAFSDTSVEFENDTDQVVTPSRFEERGDGTVRTLAIYVSEFAALSPGKMYRATHQTTIQYL